MIWQSVPLMTIIDILILGIVGYAAGAFLKARGRRPERSSESGFLAIISGLLLIALFYLADLVVMHVFPGIMPRAEAMAIMRDLHLNGSWLIALLGIGTIALGFTSVNRATAALFDGLEARQRDLGRALSEHKRIEQSLRESRDQIHLITNNLPVTIAYFDAARRFRFVNRTLERWYARPAEEILGHTIGDILGQEADDAVSRHVAAALKGKEQHSEQIIAYPDGKARTVDLTYVPHVDDSETVHGCFALGQDITARNSAERALRKQDESLRLLHRIAVAANEAAEIETAMQDCLDAVCTYTGWPVGHVYRLDEAGSNELVPVALWHLDEPERFAAFRRVTEATRFGSGIGLPGRVLESREPAWIVDVTQDPNFLRAKIAAEIGVKAGFAFPVLIGRSVVAVMEFFAAQAVNPDERILEIMAQIGTQLGRVIERKHAEEALRQSEQRFKDFASASVDWFWEMDENLRFTYFSDRLERSGMSGSQRIGRTRQEDTADDTSQPKWRDHLADLAARKPFKDFEHITRSRDGGLVHVSVSGTPIFDSSGNFKGYRGTTRDITEHKRAEEQLRKSEQRFKDIADASSDWFWESDENGRFTFVSDRYRQVTGLDPKQVIGKTREEISREKNLPAEYQKEFEKLAPYYPEHKPFRDIKIKIFSPSEQTGYWRVSGWPVFNEKGEFAGYRGATTDITEEVKTEERLRESEERLKRSAELARTGSWVWDVVNERCIYASDSLPGLLGVSRDEYFARTGLVSGPLSFVHPGDREQYNAQFERLREGHRIEFEYRVVIGNGEIRHAREIAVPVYDETGRLIREAGTYQDVTELKLAEEKLSQAQKMEAVGQLTGGVAHDFNNLLAIIMGNVELLAEASDRESPQLQAILRASLRGAKLTHRLLAFSRKQTLEPRSLDLNAAVAGITDMLRRTLGEAIEIEVVGDAGLWACEADPGQLENAILNLAINARDAMPSGGKLTIETSNVRLDDEYAAAQAEVSPGQYVMLAVSDAGSGMPPEVAEHIFEPFFTTKDVGKGSGLGLAMIYGFVKQSQGHVTVYSEVGEGTTVKIYLPRYSGDEKPGAERPATDELETGRGEVVLVVEDDADLRTLTVNLLQSLGYEVMEASNGQSGLDCLGGSARVNLLLTDVVLPGGMNGRELAEEAERRHRGLAVLYMSGYTDDAILHHDRLDEGAQLLQKPFGKSGLARAVRKALTDE